MEREAREYRCSFCGKPQREVRKLITGTRGFICDGCVIACRQLLIDDFEKGSRRGMPAPCDIQKHLDECVVGQDRAKRTLSVAVYNHLKRISLRGRGGIELTKGNILLVGPTGCGKTHLARSLASKLGVPFAMVDAAPLTQAGYVGEDVESIVARLLQAAGGDPRRAATGIIYLDEVDKLAKRGGTGRDVSGEGVQQGLLKILEGANAIVRNAHGQGTEVDTTHILFIAGGAFEGLDRAMQRHDRPASGFQMGGRPNAPVAAPRPVQPVDLHRFGFLPEFVGRFPVIVMLDALDEHQLGDILTQPRDALLKQYQKLFAMSGARLEATPDGLTAIARLALTRGTGARGLRAVMESLLLEAMFDLSDASGATYLLDGPAVEAGQPRLVAANRCG